MKILVLILTTMLIVGGAALYLARKRPPELPIQTAPPASVHETEPTLTPLGSVSSEPAPTFSTDSSSGKRPAARTSADRQAATLPSETSRSLPYQQALSTVTSLQAGYDQKQLAWQQLRDAGKLGDAIADLEQQARANPAAAEYPAALGQACLHKAGTITDIREQGILGLKADQSFDASLNLDPSNWEAGFWKAAAMSYWPPQLGKGQEVIQRFLALIDLQERQQPQPHYAQTYLSLGEQYRKGGYNDYARQIWERGARLFPGDGALAQKLTDPVPEQAAAQ